MGARPSSFASVGPPKTVVVEREWSKQQTAIFNWFKGGCSLCGGYGEYEGEYGPIACMPCVVGDDKQPHLVVRARAGTGKTTTIIEGVNRAPESSILVCAFNKKIAEELNSRISNDRAVAKTLHAVGYAAIRRQWPGVPVAQGTTRGDWLTDKVCGKDVPKQIKRLVTLLHTKGRDMLGAVPTLAVLQDLALFFDYVPDDAWRDYSLEYVVTRAQEAMGIAGSEEPNSRVGIDFADMIFLPLTHNLLHPEYDLVVVDEAQDLTLAQLTIAQQLCSGRICVVGDPNQAIYGFRGADSGSLDRLKAELGAGELPLTTTYRCAQAVCRRAQRLVPDIVAGPGNPEGIVDEAGYEDMLSAALPTQFILSRLNAPLVTITLRLLKANKRARMAGRDIGAGIQAVLKKLKVGEHSSMTTVLACLDAWESKQTTRFAAYGQLALADRCRDQADMIRAFANDADDVADLVNRIDWLFTDTLDDNEYIICSSVHKAKGLEAERVWMLLESFYRRGVNQEEQNLDYVATTRAKQHLTLVTGVPSLTR